MSKWKWRITGYYNDSVKPPKKPQGMALQVVCADDHTKDVEVQIFNTRTDIGIVNVERLPS